jgi:hypothetical protein
MRGRPAAGSHGISADCHPFTARRHSTPSPLRRCDAARLVRRRGGAQRQWPAGGRPHQLARGPAGLLPHVCVPVPALPRVHRHARTRGWRRQRWRRWRAAAVQQEGIPGDRPRRRAALPGGADGDAGGGGGAGAGGFTALFQLSRTAPHLPLPHGRRRLPTSSTIACSPSPRTSTWSSSTSPSVRQWVRACVRNVELFDQSIGEAVGGRACVRDVESFDQSIGEAVGGRACVRDVELFDQSIGEAVGAGVCEGRGVVRPVDW